MAYLYDMNHINIWPIAISIKYLKLMTFVV